VRDALGVWPETNVFSYYTPFIVLIYKKGTSHRYKNDYQCPSSSLSLKTIGAKLVPIINWRFTNSSKVLLSHVFPLFNVLF